MRIGVRLGPVSVSPSTRRRRRRSRPRQPSWHATGRATTPDGREVDFRCHHNHRTQSAAVSCADTVRKQIERGQSLNLVTRVRSTPASREAARQHALQKEADRQAKAAQHAQAAAQKAEQHAQAAAQRAEQRARATAHRAEQQEARRRARATEQAEASQRRQAAAHQRAQRKEALTAQRQQDMNERRAHRAQAARERTERQEQSARQQAERWEQAAGQRNAERPDRVHRRREERARQRAPFGWTAYGLVIGAVMFLAGFVLAASAGHNSKSALVSAGALLVFFGLVALLVSGVAALWRRLRRRPRDQASVSYTGSWNGAVPAGQPSPVNPIGYDPSAFPNQMAPDYPVHPAPPSRPYDQAPPWGA